MSNPLALLPLAIAAGNGRLSAAGSADVFEAQQLVAAGLTLLQRSAPLVRALSAKRSAILLETSPAYLTALAASDGRAAVLIDPRSASDDVAGQCRDANVGAVLTTQAFVERLPIGMTYVLLDSVPRVAQVITPDRRQDVDLGSHHGLDLEGETDADGRDEEAVVVYAEATARIFSHRTLIADARRVISERGITANDHVIASASLADVESLTANLSAPLLAGARVTTNSR